MEPILKLESLTPRTPVIGAAVVSEDWTLTTGQLPNVKDEHWPTTAEHSA